MTAQRILYMLGTTILLSLIVWQLSEATAPYPPEIQKRIEQAAKITCEIQTPRKVGTIAYLKQDEPWLIRIYTKNGEELEIWFNESTASSFSLFFPDKIYYYENGAWLNRDTLPHEEAKLLDRRLKFTGDEKQILKACIKTALETMSQKEQ